ncbi:hypothetical protein K4K51_007759 [Colletotrichum sp. SAR 10_75]|nr:hypothetical protein K4K51_007759 [Colletotrichum sp. SAR 10_75]
MAIMDEDGCTDHDPPSPISGELVSFDPNGDLYLHVGAGVEEKAKTYFVCSKALARASTVFRKMLYGGFAESGQSDVDHGWTVDLPEDRQQPMEMMLNIVHGAFEKVPEKIELTELYTFLVVTEKYDATNITRPWAKGWMEGVKTSMQNPLLLGVAYELGDYQTFNAMAMKIATECHLDHEEDLVFGFAGENRESYTYKLKNLDCLIPDGLLDDAASIRKTLLIAMLDPYLNLYGALKGGDRCMSSPGDPSGGKRCDSLLLGSLIKSFATQNLDLTANDPVKAYRGKFENPQESSTAEIRKPKPVVAIDKSGDLNLCVGADHTDEPTTFVVCSKTLARSSPVLKALLYGGFTESIRPKESHDDWVVDLPDDEPEALAIFLNIIHSNFQEIPRKPNACSVYNLLVVLDKYDCIALVQPWASSWVRLIKDTSNVAFLLCIALELGAADLFRTTFSKIINHCSLDSKDRLVYTGPSHDLSPYSPNRTWTFPHENYEHLGLFDDDEREAKRIRLDKAVMPTPTPTTIFDSKGDLHLVVGSDVRAGDPSTFLVCSRTLARASPVFDKMLFGPFVEARPSPELSKQESAWVVHLPEDDPNHLGVVLNILHCNFKMVPQNFSSPLLSGMVAVADKYDCIEIFRPWVSSCIPSLDYDHFHNPKFVLHIAWHLGCIDTFRQALLAIIEHSFISEMDEIFIFTRPQSTGRMPPWEEPQDLHEYLGNLVPMEVVGEYHV